MKKKFISLLMVCVLALSSVMVVSAEEQLERPQEWAEALGLTEMSGADAISHIGDENAVFLDLRAKEDYLMGINFSRLLSVKYGNSISNYLNTKYNYNDTLNDVVITSDNEFKDFFAYLRNSATRHIEILVDYDYMVEIYELKKQKSYDPRVDYKVNKDTLLKLSEEIADLTKEKPDNCQTVSDKCTAADIVGCRTKRERKVKKDA